MTVPAFELEASYTVYDNKHGSKIVVKKDGDGLGLVELLVYDDDGKELTRSTFTVAEARLVARALNLLAENFNINEVT